MIMTTMALPGHPSQAIEAERTALERNVGAMASKTAELDEWLAKHEGKASSLDGPGGSFSVDDLEAAIVPADALSKQALQAAAEDMAIEDTLYSLERGLQNGIVEPEAYLKQVRRPGKSRVDPVLPPSSPLLPRAHVSCQCLPLPPSTAPNHPTPGPKAVPEAILPASSWTQGRGDAAGADAAA